MAQAKLTKNAKVINVDETQVAAFVDQGWQRVGEGAAGAVVPNESPGSIQARQERIAAKGSIPLKKGDDICFAEEAQVATMIEAGWKHFEDANAKPPTAEEKADAEAKAKADAEAKKKAEEEAAKKAAAGGGS